MDNQYHPELIDESVFIAPGAVVLGDVRISTQSSVWYNAVLRGDTDTISIGPRTNVQDGAVIHVDAGMPCLIGAGVHYWASRRGAWRTRRG
jgi:carbonic anhydrase/acetyltransferase-like protein (isoleucine patch superfamily)